MQLGIYFWGTIEVNALSESPDYFLHQTYNQLINDQIFLFFSLVQIYYFNSAIVKLPREIMVMSQHWLNLLKLSKTKAFYFWPASKPSHFILLSLPIKFIGDIENIFKQPLQDLILLQLASYVAIYQIPKSNLFLRIQNFEDCQKLLKTKFL